MDKASPWDSASDTVCEDKESVSVDGMEMSEYVMFWHIAIIDVWLFKYKVNFRNAVVNDDLVS